MNLRTIRRKKNITQFELELRSGVDQSTISQLETGKIKFPSYDAVIKLARALDVNPEELIPREVA